MALTYWGINYYLNNHKDQVISEIEEWYANNYYGTLSFEDVSISSFENFPSMSMTVKNILLVDSLYSIHKYKTLAAEEVQLVVSFQKLIKKKIQFKSIIIKNGEFNLITDSTGYSNGHVFISKSRKNQKSNSKENWFSHDNAKIQIKNFQANVFNFEKNKRITSQIDYVSTTVKPYKDGIKGSADVDILMHEMGLNLDNGTFFNEARVSASFDYHFDKTKEELVIPEFDLKVKNQDFKAKIGINTTNIGSFSFSLENKKTNYEEIKTLVSQNIEKQLDKYAIEKPFYTFTTLEGSFAYRSNPLVKIKFSGRNNKAVVYDTITIANLNFKGNFINRISATATENQDKKNLTLYFDSITGAYKDIDFRFKETKFSNVVNTASVDLKLDANGKSESLNTLLKNEDFFFSKGTFSLNSTYNGAITSLDNLLIGTNSSLQLFNNSVYYKPTEISVKIDTLDVHLFNKNAVLETLKIPLDTGEKLVFSGKLNNFTSLLYNRSDPVSSQLNIFSKDMIWLDFIKIFETLDSDKPKKDKSEVNPNLLLRKSLQGIYAKFNPSVNLKLQSFNYDDFLVKSISTKAHYIDENTIYLEDTGFIYENGKVNLNAIFDISQAGETGFDIDFKTEQLDLGKILRAFDYFNLSSFKKADEIQGEITIDSNLEGIIDDVTGLKTKTLKGEISFDLKNAQLKGFAPIQKIGNIAFRKERFEDIRFAPIKNTLFIDDDVIEIPQMEIQSTAFNLFIEGHLDYGNKTNIWVSVPLRNIKKRDLNEIPDKLGYIESGKKVFIEVIDNGEGTLDYKLHLTNKKLYEAKDILDEYHDDKKKERQLRRAYKKKLRIKNREERRNNG